MSAKPMSKATVTFAKPMSKATVTFLARKLPHGHWRGDWRQVIEVFTSLDGLALGILKLKQDYKDYAETMVCVDYEYADPPVALEAFFALGY